MPHWFTADAVIVAAVIAIAITALARLMRRKRDLLLDELAREARAAERKRKIAERKAQNRAV